LTEKTLRREGKVGGKNPRKYMHKLNKQQRERIDLNYFVYPKTVVK